MIQHDSPIKFSSGPVFDVTAKKWGADPRGVSDSSAAFNNAIDYLDSIGGGTLIVPPGTYVVSQPIGRTTGYIRQVVIRGTTQRGVRWKFGDGALDPEGNPWVAGAYIRSSANVPVITGMWENCSFEHLCMDADMRGSSCIKAHFSKSRIFECEFVGWSGIGLWFNDGTFTDDLGFLNRIEQCNISDTGEEVGVAIQLEYRFIDSWVMYNNIESYSGANIQINSGGPFRIIGNHMNGNRKPLHNILINGGVRELLISNNILEGSRQESIKYTGPGWLTTPENAAIIVSGNIVRDAANSGGRSIFNFDGVGGVGFVAKGLSILGNAIQMGGGATHAVRVKNFADVSMFGNYWRNAHDNALDPVLAIGCTGVEVVGNHGDNAVDTTE